MAQGVGGHLCSPRVWVWMPEKDSPAGATVPTMGRQDCLSSQLGASVSLTVATPPALAAPCLTSHATTLVSSTHIGLSVIVLVLLPWSRGCASGRCAVIGELGRVEGIGRRRGRREI